MNTLKIRKSLSKKIAHSNLVCIFHQEYTGLDEAGIRDDPVLTCKNCCIIFVQVIEKLIKGPEN